MSAHGATYSCWYCDDLPTVVLGVGVDLVALPVQLVAQHGHLQAVHVRTLALDDARQVPPRRANLLGVLGHMGKYASIFNLGQNVPTCWRCVQQLRHYFIPINLRLARLKILKNVFRKVFF